MDWTGLDWIGLDWIGLDWIVSYWSTVQCSAVQYSAVQCSAKPSRAEPWSERIVLAPAPRTRCSLWHSVPPAIVLYCIEPRSSKHRGKHVSLWRAFRKRVGVMPPCTSTYSSQPTSSTPARLVRMRPADQRIVRVPHQMLLRGGARSGRRPDAQAVGAAGAADSRHVYTIVE